MGKSVPDISVNAVANLGYADGRFGAFVFPGDTLAARSTVIGLRETREGKSGIVYLRTAGSNQRGRGCSIMSAGSWCRSAIRPPRRPIRKCRNCQPPSPPTGSTLPDRLDLSGWDLRGRRLALALGRFRGGRAHRPCGRDDDRGGLPHDGDPPLPEHGAGHFDAPCRRKAVSGAGSSSAAMSSASPAP